MKKFIKLTAFLLCLAMLTSTFTGCGLFGGGDDEPEDEFNPPYLENYYVNKHEPVCVTGGIEVYKYESDKDALWMGGHAYHSGFVFRANQTGDEKAQVDLPLDGAYENISFVIGGQCGKIEMKVDENGNEVPMYSSSYSCSPPTLVGQAKEVKVGLQFWADDKMVDEVLFSNYQTPVRYTYNVAGAQKFTFKIVAGGRELSPNGVPVLELTVWEGEAHETGHVPSPAGSQPVQLIKDLKPYLIPSTSGAVYYPNATPSSEGRAHINMCGIKYENVVATYVSMGLTENDNEEIYFNLEGKYNYLTFTAGVADRTTTYSEGTAWLTVYADGKMIYEEVYSSHELQKKVTLNISGCHQLVFAWQSDEGNMEYGLSTGNFFGIGDAYVATTEAALNTIQYSSRDLPDRPVKMMSELGAFSIFSNMQDDAVFDGSTQFHTFSMGGVKYNEGIMLHATNTMLMTKPANASFNLDGKYNTISFIAGHISNSNVYENDQIEIYADGNLIKTIDVKCTLLPQEYIIDVTGCRHLEFVSGKQTNTLMERPVIGIANLVAYPDGYVETDFFPERKPADFGNTCDLIDTFGFYDVYNSHVSTLVGAVSVVDGYYDGTTNKNTFTVGGKTYNKGILLQTNIHLELDMAGVGAAAILGGGGVWGPGLLILALAGSGEAHESAFAMANIKDSGYTSVTFTVGMQHDRTGEAFIDDETTLMIGADDECVKEITLSKDMEPTTYTVELGEDCDRLIFWLNCAPENNGSHSYAIYDITLNK